jgi:hypothetical protein
MVWDKLFLKTELFKNVDLTSSKKQFGAPVIDIQAVGK